jgi:hypothetical protein
MDVDWRLDHAEPDASALMRRQAAAIPVSVASHGQALHEYAQGQTTR